MAEIVFEIHERFTHHMHQQHTAGTQKYTRLTHQRHIPHAPHTNSIPTYTTYTLHLHLPPPHTHLAFTPPERTQSAHASTHIITSITRQRHTHAPSRPYISSIYTYHIHTLHTTHIRLIHIMHASPHTAYTYHTPHRTYKCAMHTDTIIPYTRVT